MADQIVHSNASASGLANESQLFGTAAVLTPDRLATAGQTAIFVVEQVAPLVTDGEVVVPMELPWMVEEPVPWPLNAPSPVLEAELGVDLDESPIGMSVEERARLTQLYRRPTGNQSPDPHWDFDPFSD